MEQWSDKLDAFLEFNEQKLLTHAGKIKAEVAKKLAEERYDKFDENRKTEEANMADEEDLKELEEIEKKLLQNKDGEKKNDWKKVYEIFPETGNTILSFW